MAGTPLTRETVENTPTGAVEFDPSLLIEEGEETPVEVPTDPIVGAMGDEGAQAIAAYFQTHPEDAPAMRHGRPNSASSAHWNSRSHQRSRTTPSLPVPPPTQAQRVRVTAPVRKATLSPLPEPRSLPQKANPRPPARLPMKQPNRPSSPRRE